jgi:hypothetical protein
MRKLYILLALCFTFVSAAETADNVKLASAYATPNQRQEDPAPTQDKGAGDAFIGLRGGAESRFGVDFGLGFGRSGATTWGLAFGYTTKTPDKETSGYYNASAPGTFTHTTETRGYNVGLFGDVGRAYFAVGAEVLTETKQSTTVYSDHTSSTTPEVSKSKAGAYAQVGFKISRGCGLYVHGGSATGIGAGISLHF